MAKNSTAAATHDDQSSREKILRAAENLFADQGFNGASLRQIALKAGVPLTLITYHFGNKLGVYRAIFERHTPAIVEQRYAGLDIAEMEDDLERRLEMIIKAILLPMLKLHATQGTSDFGILLVREIGDPQAPGRGIVEELLDPIAVHAVDALRRALPGHSEAQIHWAYHAIVGVMAFTMSDTGRIKRLSGGAADPEDTDATVRQLVVLLLGGINAQFRERNSRS